MAARDRYAEVGFELGYGGERSGVGIVRLTPVLGNGTGRIDEWEEGLFARWAYWKMDAMGREMGELLARQLGACLAGSFYVAWLSHHHNSPGYQCFALVLSPRGSHAAIVTWEDLASRTA